MPNPNKDAKGLKSNDMLNGITDTHSDSEKKHMFDVELKNVSTAGIKLDEMVKKLEREAMPVFSESDLVKLAEFFKEEDGALAEPETDVVSTLPDQNVAAPEPAQSVVSIELPADVAAGDTGDAAPEAEDGSPDVDLDINIDLNALMGDDDGADAGEDLGDNAELAEQLKVSMKVVEGLLSDCNFADAVDKVNKILSEGSGKNGLMRNVLLDRLLVEFDGMIDKENKPVEEEIEEAKEDVAGPSGDVAQSPSLLQVSLPANVNPSDVKVTVQEATEGGTATIQIALPTPVSPEDIDVTLAKPADVPVAGNAGEPEVGEPEEDEPEGEETVAEAEALNKKLLPVAENHSGMNYKIVGILREAATNPDTSFNTNLLKETHLYWKNGGKDPSDYMFPIADKINGNLMASPEAIKRVSEMFASNMHNQRFSEHEVKVVRMRLAAYLEALGLDIPWKETSNLVITENEQFLRISQDRKDFNPYKVFQKQHEKNKK